MDFSIISVNRIEINSKKLLNVDFAIVTDDDKVVELDITVSPKQLRKFSSFQFAVAITHEIWLTWAYEKKDWNGMVGDAFVGRRKITGEQCDPCDINEATDTVETEEGEA